MPNFFSRFPAQIALSIAMLWPAVPAHGQDAPPDKKGSQAAYQGGLRADAAGRRDEAIAAYTAGIAADGGNGAAWNPPAKDYLAAGERDKAQADVEQAVKVQPGSAETYAARADFYTAIGEPARAIQDYNTALAMKLERGEIYDGRGKAYLATKQYQQESADFRSEERRVGKESR